MDLENIVEVVELRNIDNVNKLLANGWKLIKTFTISDDVFTNWREMRYVLGRPVDVEFKHNDLYGAFNVGSTIL